MERTKKAIVGVNPECASSLKSVSRDERNGSLVAGCLPFSAAGPPEVGSFNSLSTAMIDYTRLLFSTHWRTG
jgi:hypothetical protein